MIEHFVGTQRSDRTGIDRDKLPQDEATNHSMDINASEIIFISRKRLCNQSSSDTRHIWSVIIHELKKIDPELASVCVPECIYRGFCPEAIPCNYNNTTSQIKEIARYQKQCQKNRS